MEKNMYTKDNLANIAKMNEVAPDVMKAFWAFDKASVAGGAVTHATNAISKALEIAADDEATAYHG